MQISMKARAAVVLVPLALAGTCLACAPVGAWADAANTTETTTAAVAVASEQEAAETAGSEVFANGVLTFAGVQVTLPADMNVQAAGTLANAENADGTLTAAVENVTFATLPEKADLEAAFTAAASKTVSGYATASVEQGETLDLGNGAKGYVFNLEASGPYEAVENADGTTTASTVGPEGHWSITQVYVAPEDGGFALVQVAVSEKASAEDVAAAKTAVESVAIAPAAEQTEAEKALAAQNRASAGGFTFALPQGLEGSDGVWLGTTDAVLVETTGTLVQADDAKKLTDEDVQALFEAAAKGMGGTFEGSSVRTVAGADVTVGVFALANGAETYECLMVLVPVADGSIEGLTAVCAPAAAQGWADKLDSLINSIEVTPGE